MTQRHVELVVGTMAGMAGAMVGFIVHDRWLPTVPLFVEVPVAACVMILLWRAIVRHAADMTRQDFAEYVGWFAFTTIVSLTLGQIGHAYHWPGIEGAIACAGIGGFTWGEVRRRAKARRQQGTRLGS